MDRTQPWPETQPQALTSRPRPQPQPGATTELNLPGWEQLPAARRHRLVARLSELVQRTRVPTESRDDGE